MKKIQKKKGVTILALVITIIIMLLLAGVVMQMALGDNGLIAKVSQSKVEQAKAELYETARIEYLSLKTKAIAKDEEEPPVSEVLSAEGFLAKYDVNGDNITDKKGEVIDTKDNLLAKLSGMVGSGSGGHTTQEIPEMPTPQPYPEQNYPKTIDGITIYEHDKDKMILKINIKEHIKLEIRGNGYTPETYKVEVEWGNGGYDVFRPDYQYSGTTTGEHEYYPGNYIMKIKGAKSFKLINKENKYDKFEVTVLHWGKFEEENNYSENNAIELYSVKDIKMPEPNDITVNYIKGLFERIPEDLFKYKPTRKKISTFQECENLTSIPEELYKYNTEMEILVGTFLSCNNLKSIPENLLKYNRKLKEIHVSFSGTGIESVPEGLFKYNKELLTINTIFSGSIKIESIPEGLFKENKKLVAISNIFQNCSKIESIPENLFRYNTNLKDIAMIAGRTSIKNIPENLFKHNTEVKNFNYVFSNLTKLESIPENIFKYNKKVENFERAFENDENLKEIPEDLFVNNIEAKSFMLCFIGNYKLKTIPANLFKNNVKAENFGSVFQNCREIESIPENLFANNIEAKKFDATFAGTNITNIPWNLFINNNSANSFISTFAYCNSLTYLNLPNRCYSLQESQYRAIFVGCTNAHNYSSIPESWKNW